MSNHIHFDKDEIKSIIKKYKYPKNKGNFSKEIYVKSIIINTLEESKKHGYPIGTWLLIDKKDEK